MNSLWFTPIRVNCHCATMQSFLQKATFVTPCFRTCRCLGKKKKSFWVVFSIWLYLNLNVTRMLWKPEQSLNLDFVSGKCFWTWSREQSAVWGGIIAELKINSQTNLGKSVVCCSLLFSSVLCCCAALWAERGGCSYEKIRSSSSDKSLWGQRSSCSLL